MKSIGISTLFVLAVATLGIQTGCGSSRHTNAIDSATIDDSGPGRLSPDSNAYHVDTADIGTVPEQEHEDTIPSQHALSLNMTSYVVPDTVQYHSFRLYVKNAIDTAAIIDRVEPSCGCILTTVQKSLVLPDHDGEIYIALTVDRMSNTQPYTVDVYTNQNPTSPLRLWIWKGKVLDQQGTK
jgi:hypothetical protein